MKIEITKNSEKNDNLKKWFKDPYNLILIGILLFAFGIRLYYLFLTLNQPLWWDEAEYIIKAKNIAFGTPDTGWFKYRPLFFPFLAAFFFILGLGIVGIKILWLLISIFGVLLVYLIGKELFDEKISLIATLIYSVFYLDIFYMCRLLVDMPAVVFSLLAIYFFLKREKKTFAFFIIPLIIIGSMIRFSVSLTFIILFVYLFLIKGFSLLKEKNLIYSSLIGLLLLIPIFIWSVINFGGPLNLLYRLTLGGGREQGFNQFSVLMQYITYFPNYIYTILFILFLIGLLFFYDLIFAIDLIKNKKFLQSKLLLVLWIIIPILVFGLLINHFEDRYIAMIFPAVFYIISYGLVEIASIIDKNRKLIFVLIIIIFLLVGIYPMFNYTKLIINQKINSYIGVKEAGIWLKENSKKSDVIFGSSIPQLTFYSERVTYGYPDNESDFNKKIEELKPRYMVLTIWEKSPLWVYSWPEKNNRSIKLVYVSFIDKENKKPDTLIYEFIQSS